MLLLLLIQNRDAALAGIKASDSSLKKLDLRLTQNLQKRATKDALMGGKLVESGAYREGVCFVDQSDLGRLVGHFAGQTQGKEQARNPRAKNKNTCGRLCHDHPPFYY
jgi:hypothetical protein